MRHLKAGKKLNRTSAHREALIRNMVASLVEYERIQTTPAKAEMIIPHMERLITLGKRGDLASRRMAFRTLRNDLLLRKLFSELAERYRERTGGYTRVIRLAEYRRGDAAPLSMLELVDSPVFGQKLQKIEEKRKKEGEPKKEEAGRKEAAPEEEKRGWRRLQRMLGWKKKEVKEELTKEVSERGAAYRKTAKGTGRSGGKKDSRGKAR